MEKHLIAAALAAGMLLAGATFAVQDAQDQPSTRPAERPERAIRGGQVVRPYNLLDDLALDQERQIGEIRPVFLRGVRELERVEREGDGEEAE